MSVKMEVWERHYEELHQRERDRDTNPLTLIFDSMYFLLDSNSYEAEQVYLARQEEDFSKKYLMSNAQIDIGLTPEEYVWQCRQKGREEYLNTRYPLK